MTTMEEQHRLDMEYVRRLREAEDALNALCNSGHYIIPSVRRGIDALLEDLDDERQHLVRRWN